MTLRQPAAEAGRLHEQERPEYRRPEQRADRGEAAGRPDDQSGLGGGVLLADEMKDEDAEPSAQGDQGCFGAEHGAEGQGGEGGEDDAGELDRLNPAGRLEPLGRLVAARTREVHDAQGDEQTTQREREDRPPRGSPAEPTCSGSVVKTHCWASAMSFKKKYAMAATGTPMTAPNTSNTT